MRRVAGPVPVARRTSRTGSVSVVDNSLGRSREQVGFEEGRRLRVRIDTQIDGHPGPERIMGGTFDDVEMAFDDPAAMELAGRRQADGVVIDAQLEWLQPRLPGDLGHAVLE